MGRASPAVLIGAALAVLWIVLSGRFEPMLLLSGVASVGIALFLASRMRILDEEAAGYRRIGSLLLYWLWLGGEIVKANLAVARAVLDPRRVEPGLVRVPAGQETDFGRAVFANSITLTPGTVTVDVGDHDFLVHALMPSMTGPEGFRDMGERARLAAEGGAP